MCQLEDELASLQAGVWKLKNQLLHKIHMMVLPTLYMTSFPTFLLAHNDVITFLAFCYNII